PLAQAIKGAKPHAAISGRENRPGSGTRQTLIRGNRSDREIAKAIEAVFGGDPDVAFTIFKHPGDEIPGQTVRLRIHVCLALVYMHEAAVDGTDPQAAITIAQQTSGLESGWSARKKVGNDFPVLRRELPDSVFVGDQRSVVLVSTRRLQRVDCR